MAIFFDPPDRDSPDPNSPGSGSSGRDSSDPESPESARSVARPRRRRALLITLVSFASLIVLGISAGAVYVSDVERAVDGNLHRLPRSSVGLGGSGGSESESARPARAKGDALNYLVLGSDSRDPANSGAGRSDAIILAHLSGDRRSAALISFPRDLWVPIPGRGRDKINAAYAYGGPDLAVRTVEQVAGVRVDHLAVVDFAGVVAVTNALGGVTLDNPHYSKSQGYEFPVGTVTIHGEEALAYVRERKQLPRGDLDRAERQRLVVQAILQKGLSPSTLANPPAFNRFVTSVASQISVDEDLSAAELRRTALSIRFTADQVASIQAPITGFGTSPGGQSIDLLDEAKMKELSEALRSDTLSAYTERYPNG